MDNSTMTEKTQGDINEEVLRYVRNQFAKLSYICKTVREICDRLETVETRIESLGQSCAQGFYQTRDAATCLREELSEASGTIIDATNFDYGMKTLIV